MYITPECGLSYWFGFKFATGLLMNATETVKPGNVVWDVGANMGLFSFASAGLAGPSGRVYAFEPDTTLVRLLRKSALLNPAVAPVEVIPCAVYDSVSLLRFNIAQRARASNFLDGFGYSQTGGVREAQTVPSVSLDWTAERIPPPDVLKIDVEGAELGVFRGGVKMLEAKRPIVLFESFVGASQDEITQLLHRLGYTLYNCDLPVADRVPLKKAAVSTLAIPS
jgi:FkbM family methyltransferase